MVFLHINRILVFFFHFDLYSLRIDFRYKFFKILLIILYSPNSVATLWGSYGNGKASGVDRWCAPAPAGNLTTLSLKNSPRNRKMHFACARRGPDEVHFGGAFSPARRVDFRKSGNVQNVRVLKGVQNRRKGCSKLEVVKNRHFSWQAQYLVLLKSVLASSKCSFYETVIEFGSAMLTSFRVAVTGLRMPRTHFFAAGAVLASQNIEKSHFVL